MADQTTADIAAQAAEVVDMYEEPRWYVESGSGERLSPEFGDEAAARCEARRLRERLVVAFWEHGQIVEDRLVFDYGAGATGADDTGAWLCDECGLWVTSTTAVASDHAVACSLHPSSCVG